MGSHRMQNLLSMPTYSLPLPPFSIGSTSLNAWEIFRLAFFLLFFFECGCVRFAQMLRSATCIQSSLMEAYHEINHASLHSLSYISAFRLAQIPGSWPIFRALAISKPAMLLCKLTHKSLKRRKWSIVVRKKIKRMEWNGMEKRRDRDGHLLCGRFGSGSLASSHSQSHPRSHIL